MIGSWWPALRMLIAYTLCLGLLAGFALTGLAWALAWVVVR